MVTTKNNFYNMIRRKYPAIECKTVNGQLTLSGPLSTEDNLTYHVQQTETGTYIVELPQQTYSSIQSLFPVNGASLNAWMLKYPFLHFTKIHKSRTTPEALLSVIGEAQNKSNFYNVAGNYYLVKINNITKDQLALFMKVPYSYDENTSTITCVMKTSSSYIPASEVKMQRYNIYNTLLLYILDFNNDEEQFNYILTQLGKTSLTKEVLKEAFLEGKFFEVLINSPFSSTEPF